MKTASIGFYRDDGDFQLLATFNNSDETIPEDVFETMLTTTFDWLNDTFRKDGVEIITLERQDAPDYVEIEPS